MMPERKNPYADILALPHRQAENRPHMSMHDRAAQFSPFAALTGFDGVIAETGRMTDRKIELSESQKLLLDQKLTLIDEVIQDGYPDWNIPYFHPAYFHSSYPLQNYSHEHNVEVPQSIPRAEIWRIWAHS